MPGRLVGRTHPQVLSVSRSAYRMTHVLRKQLTSLNPLIYIKRTDMTRTLLKRTNLPCHPKRLAQRVPEPLIRLIRSHSLPKPNRNAHELQIVTSGRLVLPYDLLHLVLDVNRDPSADENSDRMGVE